MFRYSRLPVLIAFAFLLLYSADALAYSEGSLRAAKRGLSQRQMAGQFLSRYSADPKQVATREDLLYVSYELATRIDNQFSKLQSRLTTELAGINRKVAQAGRKGSAQPSGGQALQPGALEQELRTVLPYMIAEQSLIKQMRLEMATLKQQMGRIDKQTQVLSKAEVESGPGARTGGATAGTAAAIASVYFFTLLFMSR